MNKSNANAKRNGYIGLGAMIVLACATVFGTDPLYKAIDNSIRPEIYVPGTYTGTAKGYGGIVTADVTVSGKTIDSITVNGEKETLLNLVLPGLTDSILAKQSTQVDAVSGATLSSNAIKQAVDQALAQARGEEEVTVPETTGESAETPSALKEGTYTYESPEFDENGFKDQVSMTVKDNAITGVTWDCIKEDGSKKSQLSMEGKYVMTENGPKWHEQADAVVDYVLEHQSLEGLVNEKGYTDSVSSVSINLMGFVNGVKDCLNQASGESMSRPSELKEGSYTYESPEFDENGFKDQVSMTVKDNAITGVTWDCIKEDGSKKSQLSMEGKYVMTENGPKWHEQADAVVDYVLEHQSLEGLVNEKGYTDSVSSVSINLMGFVNGVKDCLNQAAMQ